jgi:uncharacterized protein (DUF1015 family)
MAELRPFRSLTPPPKLAAHVASPPYDTVTVEEARALARGNPHSFLRVTLPESEAPADPARLPELARERLEAFIQQGWLVREPRECFYLYRLEQGPHVQTGVVALASVEAYDVGNIRRHELTHPDKEEERTRHFEAIGGNDEPVFLVYRARAEIDQRVAQICATPPELSFTAPDGVIHTLWRVRGDDNSALSDSFRRVHLLYVADGHHRTAAASRVSRQARERDQAVENRPEDWFLSVAFPHDQVKILPYHRLVRDLDGIPAAKLLARLEEDFEVEPEDQAPKLCEHEFGLFLENRWWRLSAHGGTSLDAETAHLDVAMLHHNVLRPLLGIRDPRTDKRLAFVSGEVGLEVLENKVRSGEFAAAFALYPTPLEQVLALADAGEILPPKSTWFAPKLRSGLVVYRYR